MTWSGTPAPATGAIPLMNAAGTEPVNTAANYRLGFIGALIAPAPGGPMAWRSGVLPTALLPGATVNSDLSVAATATASSSVTVAAGNCVISRTGAAGGPYLVNFDTPTILISDPAATTNPRIDLVCVQLVDAALGDTGLQGGQLIIVNGTPGATPAIPPVPTGAIPLAQLYRTVNTTTIGAGNITDVRRSTSTYGGMRALLPGDQSGDPGAYIGECTYDAVTPFKSGPRYWDGTTWRGILTTVVPFTQVIGLTQSVNWNGGNGYTLCTATVPDPGYPYYLTVSAKAGGSNLTSPAQVITFVSLDGATVISTAWSTNGSNTIWESHNPAVHTGKLTGSHTIYHELVMNAPNDTAAMSNNATDIYLTVDVIPF